MTVLITGGAGYIGSHIVRLLKARDGAVVADNLQSGFRERIAGTPLVEMDLTQGASVPELRAVIREHHVDSVIHMAALKQAGESVREPVRYFRDNVSSLANVLEAIEDTQVDRFVFSSSAAVYGNPPEGRVTEGTATDPVNPYGSSKLAGEWLVRDFASASGIRALSLRYFNVAGAGWDDLGDTVPMNLVTLAIDALEHDRKPQIFGDDYPTRDGTGVRDYIHVRDLATAHIAALDYLRGKGEHSIFNVGTGTGASVREVLSALGKASGIEFEPEVVQRRPGDPAEVVADPSRILSEFNWEPEHNVQEMVESAWRARRAE